MEVARAVGDADRNGLTSESADQVLGEGMFQSHVYILSPNQPLKFM